VTRRAVLFVVLALCAACSSGGPARVERGTTVPTSAVSTTTLPLAATTTTAAPVAGEVRALVTPTGIVVPVYGASQGAWQVGTPCGGRSAVRGGTPIHSATVVLDPGHGGAESGAIGPNGLTEKALNLAVAKGVKTELERSGVTVVLTRTADYAVPLDARVALVTRVKPAVFVSVHHNGGPDGPSTKPGTETYYQYTSPKSKRLAGLVYEEVFRVFGARTGIEWHANVDAGAKWRLNSAGGDYYGVLRATRGVPAVISEGLFLSSSPSEAALLARPDVQSAEGAAIARGIVRYLRGKDPGSGFVTPVPRTTPAGGGGSAGCVDPPLE